MKWNLESERHVDTYIWDIEDGPIFDRKLYSDDVLAIPAQIVGVKATVRDDDPDTLEVVPYYRRIRKDGSYYREPRRVFMQWDGHELYERVKQYALDLLGGVE